jgi:hypothetical protein
LTVVSLSVPEMVFLTRTKLNTYRARTFHTDPRLRITTIEQAVLFVIERGFIFFWPIKDINLPSLWVAVAGDRPVADAHDDPGHITWRWKDSLLGGTSWYYGKVIRKKATMISHVIAPCFYALTENYGSPDEDYLTQYEQGKMTQEAKSVYESLLNEGPLDSIALRKSARLTSRESDSRYNRALADLQADFKILPVGISEAGSWRYAFIYDIVARHYPELPEKARYISESTARSKICEFYLRSVGVAKMSDIEKIFQWGKIETQRVVDQLALDGIIASNCQLEGSVDPWIAHSVFVNGE